jgi:hypothetical protein
MAAEVRAEPELATAEPTLIADEIEKWGKVIKFAGTSSAIARMVFAKPFVTSFRLPREPSFLAAADPHPENDRREEALSPLI